MSHALRRLIVAVVVAFAPAPPVSAAFGPGVSLVVFESVTPHLAADTITVNLIGFHTGGGAISQLNVYLDCDPRQSQQCVKQPLVMLTERIDAVLGLSAFGINVPNWCGWTTGIVDYSKLAAGKHTIYAAWTDTEHGRQVWYYTTATFEK